MSVAANLSKADIYQKFGGISARYELIGDAPIGENSGFGAVWHARDTWLNCEIAIKVSDSDLGDEIRLCRDIDGETVRIFEYFRGADNWHAYTMELLHNPWITLSKYIERHKYKPNDIQHYFDSFEIIQATLHGLKTLHGTPYQRLGKVVHADIKPANLFVLIKPKKRDYSVFRMPAHSEMIKIIDLGVSVTMGSVIRGYTPGYRPEGIREGVPGYDLYALAVSFVELLTGRRPTHEQMAHKSQIKRVLAIQSSGSRYLDNVAVEFITTCKNAATQRGTTARSLIQFLNEKLFDIDPLRLLSLRHLIKNGTPAQNKADLATDLYPVLANYLGWRRTSKNRQEFAKGFVTDLYSAKFLVRVPNTNTYFAT